MVKAVPRLASQDLLHSHLEERRIKRVIRRFLVVHAFLAGARA